MKKLIYNKFDKLTIPSLKRVEYTGKIIVIYTPSEAEKAVDFLLTQPLLGLDTETRPSFSKGRHFKCALLQVWNNDLLSLRELGAFETGSFVDLQQLVREIGIEDQSLVKIYANLFGQRISKAERLSNWERDILKDSQKIYAAIDAWACIRIYEEVMRLKEEGDYELVIRPEENKQEHETDIS